MKQFEFSYKFFLYDALKFHELNSHHQVIMMLIQKNIKYKGILFFLKFLLPIDTISLHGLEILKQKNGK